MKTTIFAALAIFAATPAAASTMPLIIHVGTSDRIETSASTALEDRAQVAIEAACEKPFLRDLKGQQLYAECIADARQQVEQALAENALAGTELAAR